MLTPRGGGRGRGGCLESGLCLFSHWSLQVAICIDFGSSFCRLRFLDGFSLDLGLYFGPFSISCSLLFACLFQTWILHSFLMYFSQLLDAQNHVFYWKTNSLEHFSLFRKSMTNRRFLYPFWHNFGRLLVYIWYPFSASFFASMFGSPFSGF